MPKKIIGKVALTPRGDWNANDTYVFLDVVMDVGNMYIAKQDVPTGTPTNNTAYWFKSISGSGITFDTAMSDTSANGVENRVIKAYVDNELTDKVDKVNGKDLSSNDFTDAYKNKIGTNALTTSAQDLSGAINEHESNIQTLDTNVGNLQNKVGTASLTTDAKNLSGAVNEIDARFGDMFVTERVYYPSAISINGNATSSQFNYSVVKQGYTALAIIGWAFPNNIYANRAYMVHPSNTTVYFRLANTSSTKIDIAENTIWFDVLYVKKYSGVASQSLDEE